MTATHFADDIFKHIFFNKSDVKRIHCQLNQWRLTSQHSRILSQDELFIVVHVVCIFHRDVHMTKKKKENITMTS